MIASCAIFPNRVKLAGSLVCHWITTLHQALVLHAYLIILLLVVQTSLTTESCLTEFLSNQRWHRKLTWKTGHCKRTGNSSPNALTVINFSNYHQIQFHVFLSFYPIVLIFPLIRKWHYCSLSWHLLSDLCFHFLTNYRNGNLSTASVTMGSTKLWEYRLIVQLQKKQPKLQPNFKIVSVKSKTKYLNSYNYNFWHLKA